MYIPARIYGYCRVKNMVYIFHPEYMYIPARIYVYSIRNICIFWPEYENVAV